MGWRVGILWMAVCIAAAPAAAVTVTIDYTYDLPVNGGSNFFGAGNPQGAAGGTAAKNALGAAVSYFNAILTDTFSAIQTPAQFHGSAGGVYTWQWKMKFNNPSTNAAVELINPTVPANQYIVYVGSRTLSVNEGGQGAAGSWEDSATSVGSYTSQEIAYINATTDTFKAAVERRGQPVVSVPDFADWGGSIAFDRSAPWFFNHLGQPSGNVTDFYSVAIHELAHAIGFGQKTISPSPLAEWQKLISGSTFIGTNAIATNGGIPVPLAPSPDLGHWATGKASVVYGTATPQETAMDPEILNGTRKKLTELDAAALKDIGWSLAAAPVNYGDYNDNRVVDTGDYLLWRKYLNGSTTLPNDSTAGTNAADYTVWRRNFGKVTTAGSEIPSLVADAEVPEPSTAMLMVMVGIAAWFAHRRLRLCGGTRCR